MNPPDVFSKIEELVVKLWSFLVPPVVRLSIALLILFCFLSGPMGFQEMKVLILPAATEQQVSGPKAGTADQPAGNDVSGGTGVSSGAGTSASGKNSSTVAGKESASGDKTAASPPQFVTLLQNQGFASLVPLFLLGLVVATAYAANQLMAGISAFLPFQVMVKPQIAIAKASAEFESFWLKKTGFHGGWEELLKVITEQDMDGIQDTWVKQAKARKAAHDTIESHVQFIKFLILWTVGCAAMAMIYNKTVDAKFLWISLGVCEVVFVLFLLVMFGQHAEAKISLMVAQIKMANHTLPLPQPGPTETQVSRVQNAMNTNQLYPEFTSPLASPKWWTIKWAVSDLILPFKGLGKFEIASKP